MGNDAARFVRRDPRPEQAAHVVVLSLRHHDPLRLWLGATDLFECANEDTKLAHDVRLAFA